MMTCAEAKPLLLTYDTGSECFGLVPDCHITVSTISQISSTKGNKYAKST